MNDTVLFWCSDDNIIPYAEGKSKRNSEFRMKNEELRRWLHPGWAFYRKRDISTRDVLFSVGDIHSCTNSAFFILHSEFE